MSFALKSMSYRKNMKAKINKKFLLTTAIKHYLKGYVNYTFMSLYDDFEPFPLHEVIELQKERIGEIKAEITQCETEFLKGQLLKNEMILKKLEKLI